MCKAKVYKRKMRLSTSPYTLMYLGHWTEMCPEHVMYIKGGRKFTAELQHRISGCRNVEAEVFSRE